MVVLIRLGRRLRVVVVAVMGNMGVGMGLRWREKGVGRKAQRWRPVVPTQRRLLRMLRFRPQGKTRRKETRLRLQTPQTGPTARRRERLHTKRLSGIKGTDQPAPGRTGCAWRRCSC
jgi:hypothetical protein